MKIILFSDIHANLPALEAFFKDAALQEPDAIYCLGDLVGYNTWPNEVIQEIRRRMIPTIAGNYDFGIGLGGDDCGCAYKNEIEKANGQVSIQYTNSVVGAPERQFLRSLPSQIRLEFQLNGDKLQVLFVHGSPRKINEYLFEERDEKSMLRIMRDADADVLCFGHTHKPYHRIMQDSVDGVNRFRHAVNTGSVGKPKDGDPRGGYVVMEINEHSSVTSRQSISIEFIRFTYDIEKAARAVEASLLPDVYAENLRTGR